MLLACSLMLSCGRFHFESVAPECRELECTGGRCTPTPLGVAVCECDPGYESRGLDRCVESAACTDASDCTGGTPCTIAACVSGRCAYRSMDDGVGCDDGAYCTVDDRCYAGHCLGFPRDCAGTGEACSAACDEATDACTDAAEGDPCDGVDRDLCSDGMLACDGTSLYCTDDTSAVRELCDGVDNDCDPTTADGVDEPTYGDACDGPDSDMCAEGVIECDETGLRCTDDTGDALDTCDGIDNDCNPATEDGSAEATYGDPCDGDDLDTCEEGSIACDGASLYCSDQTDRSLENLCNLVDDDCDGETVSPPADLISGTDGNTKPPILAFANTHFGAVWTDYRNGQSASGELGEVWFAQVALDGTVVVGSEVSLTSSRSAKAARLAYSPELDRFGVAWMEESPGGWMEIQFAMLEGDGTEVSGSRVNVSSTSTNSWFPEIAWSGSLGRFAVTWREFGDCTGSTLGNIEACVVLIEPPGTVRASSLTNISRTPGNDSPPTGIVWAGDRFVVVFTDDQSGRDEVYIDDLRFDATDNLVGSVSPVRISDDNGADSYQPALAYDSDRNEVGLSWRDLRSGTSEIYFGRADFGGPLGANTKATTYTGSQGRTNIVYGDAEYLVTWHDGRTGNSEIHGSLWSTATASIRAEVQLTNDPGTSWIGSVVWAGSFYAVGFYDTRSDGVLRAFTTRFVCE